MSYTEITSFNSPNYNIGRPAGSPAFIVIHHWGNDGQNFYGVVEHLCCPDVDKSAHYVAEAGKVACIVAPYNRAWHAGAGGNPRGIGIECRPECSASDRETVAELIANLRKTYGYLPLYPHNHFMPTACPGRWENYLPFLDRRAEEYRAGVTAKHLINKINKGENKMKNVGIYWKAKDGATRCAILNTASGFWAAHSNGKEADASYNNPLATAFSTPSWAKVTEAHANVLAAACAEIRAQKGA